MSWWYASVITVSSRGFKDLLSLRIFWEYLIGPFSFKILVTSLGSKGLTTTGSGGLVGFSVSKSSTSFVYIELVGGGDGCLQGLRDDVDFAGGIFEFGDILSVMFKIDQL